MKAIHTTGAGAGITTEKEANRQQREAATSPRPKTKRWRRGAQNKYTPPTRATLHQQRQSNLLAAPQTSKRQDKVKTVSPLPHHTLLYSHPKLSKYPSKNLASLHRNQHVETQGTANDYSRVRKKTLTTELHLEPSNKGRRSSHQGGNPETLGSATSLIKGPPPTLSASHI